MSPEQASMITKKAMAFDLFNILDNAPEKREYTTEEIKALIKAYILASGGK